MRIKLLIALCFVLTILSCSDDNVSQVDKKEVYSKEQIKLVSTLRKTALDICLITSNKETFQEIRAIVNLNIKFGQDENARFKDLIENGQSVYYTGNQLKKAPTVNRLFTNLCQSINNDSTETFLINNNIQIYWPYSENWDESKVPVVTYEPLNKMATEVVAYKLNQNGTIDSLIVDEEYAKNNPVWVINQNNTDYDNLPNFIKGKTVKNNIIYLIENSSKLPLNVAENLPLNDSTYVYSLYIGSMKAVKQWDTWIAGGSEFKFRMVGAKLVGGVQSTDYSMAIVSAPAFTRNDISNKKTKILNSLINIDWGIRETANGFALWEDDGGSSSQPVKFDVGYDKIKVSAEFKIGSVDDLIYQIALDRNSFFSINKVDNGNGLVDGFAYNTSGGVYWTMPWIITKRAY